MEVDGILKKKSLNKNLRLKVLTAGVVNYFKISKLFMEVNNLPSYFIECII